MPPTRLKSSGETLKVPLPATQSYQQPGIPVLGGFKTTGITDYSCRRDLSNQTTAAVSCGAGTGLFNPTQPDFPSTPTFNFEQVQSIESSSWNHTFGFPAIQQYSTYSGPQLDNAIDLNGKLGSDAGSQSIAANASSQRAGLSRRGFAQANATWPLNQSSIPLNRSRLSTTVLPSAESTPKSTTKQAPKAQVPQSEKRPPLNRFSSEPMGRDYQSRTISGEGMRPARRDEFEGTNILPPMFRDEYIKSDAEGSSTGPASTTAEGNGNNRRTIERQSADDSQPITGVLPVEKSFPIQIGSELFRLSGASIMSDG